MSYPELHEGADVLEIRSPMSVGMRVFLAGMGLIPLLAPYELVIKIDWERFMSPFFLLAALVSAGAIVVSALFVFAGIAGLSSRIVLDRRAETFSYFSEAPVVRRTRRIQPLSDIRSVAVDVREWSDGPPTYHLGITVKDGTVFETGSCRSRDEIERIRSRVDQFLAAIVQ